MKLESSGAYKVVEDADTADTADIVAPPVKCIMFRFPPARLAPSMLTVASRNAKSHVPASDTCAPEVFAELSLKDVSPLSSSVLPGPAQYRPAPESAAVCYALVRMAMSVRERKVRDRVKS